jgi:hypothetical protein
MESGVSTAGGGGPAPAKRRIHPFYFAALVAIVVAVLPFGLRGLQFLGGLLLAASIGFLLTLIIWPSGITFASRLLCGFGLGLLLVCYTGLWLAKLHLLNRLGSALAVELLIFTVPAVYRGRIAFRQHASHLHQIPRISLGHLREAIVIIPFVLLFIYMSMALQDPFPIGSLDAGFFFGLAREVDSHDGFITIYPYLDPPAGRPVSQVDQGLPVLAVIASRITGINLLTVCQYFPLVSFVLLLVAVFLIGRALAGRKGGLFAALFLCTLPMAMGFLSFKNFDNDMLKLVLSGWTGYFLIRLFSAHSVGGGLAFGVWGGTTYGLFGLVWPGWLYLVPAMVGGLILLLVARILLLLRSKPVAPKVAKAKVIPISLDSVLVPHLHVVAGICTLLLVSSSISLLFGGANWTDLLRAGSAYATGKSLQLNLGQPAYSLLEGIEGMYGNPSWITGLTVLFVLLLLFSGILYLYLSRNPSLPFLLAWLLLLLAIVWPGRGFQGLFYLWPPLLVPLMSAGLVLWVEKSSRRLSWIWPLILMPLFLYNVVSYPPAFRSSMSIVGTNPEVSDAVRWIIENTPENATVAAPWPVGYLVAGFGRVSLSDPAGWMSAWVEQGEENGLTVLPHRVGVRVGERTYQALQVIPWRGYPFSGRAIDSMAWIYLDENELADLLRFYRDHGIRIDYLCAGRYEPSRSVGFIREGDILEWADNISKTAENSYVLTFGDEKVFLQFRPEVEVWGTNPYNLAVAQEIAENRFLLVSTSIPSGDPARRTILLVEGKGGLRAALCRTHTPIGKLLSENLFDNLPSYLKVEFNGAMKILRVDHTLF